MKAKIVFCLCLTILAHASLYGQKDIVSDYFLIGDTVTLKIDNAADSVFWQSSTDLLNWNSIVGAHTDSLEHVVDTTCFIRAGVVHGDCAPYFSDTFQVHLILPPVADFSSFDTTVTIGETVLFLDNSTNMPDTWHWAFGDGGTSTQQNPTHVYQNTGDYDITLVVSNPAGSDSLTKNTYITVNSTLPTVYTGSVAGLNYYGANVNGSVIDNGGDSVSAYGVCWNKTGLPTLLDSFSVDGSGVGSFVSILSGLETNTTYYARAYASNTVGTGYGAEVSFTTLNALIAWCSPPVSDYDGNTYNTVLIGQQCWMKSNLKSIHYSNGDLIPHIHSVPGWFHLQNNEAAYCYQNYDSTLTDVHGILYTWPAAMQTDLYNVPTVDTVQGICPVGWHLPSDEEWKLLEGNVDSQYGYPDPEWDVNAWRGYDSGKNIKTTSGWSTGNGTNSFGFSAQSSGQRNIAGSFSGLNSMCQWWSSTQWDTAKAFSRSLNYFNDGSYRNYPHKFYGLSVRCLKDPGTIQAPDQTVFTETISNISQTTTLVGGEIASNIANPIIARGLCWNTFGHPSVHDSVSVDSSGVGTFMSQLSGLLPNTRYYVKAYAISSVDTLYGNEETFMTLVDCPISVTDVEGNVYNTIVIGTQCWMKSNLRTTHYANGDSIPYVAADSTWDDLAATDTACCYLENNASYVPEYGVLYSWQAVVGSDMASSIVPSGVQGVCPDGWHVPSMEEFQMLEGEVDSQYGYPNLIWDEEGWHGFDSGKNLKSVSGWNSGGNGTDLYGFSAKPSSDRIYNGNFPAPGNHCHFWTSAQYNNSYAYSITISAFRDDTDKHEYSNKTMGFSVRCVKD